MKRTLLLALSLGGSLLLRAQYSIPMGDIAIRDPFVTVDVKNQRYVIVTTAHHEGHFGFRAYESRDLRMWRDCGIVGVADEGYTAGAVPGKDSWWAPDTYAYRGRYYTIVTFSRQEDERLRCCTLFDGGKEALGPYRSALTEAENVSLTPSGQQCLDGSLYVDRKGCPWLVYSKEWNGPDVQNEIGETWAIRLRKDLKGTKGKPIRLFRASDAGWPRGEGANVVDAPYIVRDAESGNLILLWSSFQNGVYCIGQAVSRSGKVEGPWEHLPEVVYRGGGHQMVFQDLQGNWQMSFHKDNNNAHLCILPIAFREGRVVLK